MWMRDERVITKEDLGTFVYMKSSKIYYNKGKVVVQKVQSRLSEG